MKTFIVWICATLFAIVVWGTGNYLATVNGWLLTPLAPPNDPNAFFNALTKEVNANFKGNVSLMMLEKGEVIAQHHVSKGAPVTQNSIFGVASLGKWVAATGVMTLVEAGYLDLDEPVSTYLTRWQLPPSQFDNNGVTLRRLLSHTAGITDGLGHDGFPPGTPVQPLVEHLTKAQDAEPDKNGRVAVGIEPGTQWKYSGGSYNLTQLIIEEVSGMSFAEYMQQAVFQPLGMTNTAYQVNRDSPQTAQYFNDNGTLRVYPDYTSLAATGLYSTSSDIAKFVASQIPSHVTNSTTPRILTDASLAHMREPVASVQGLDIWGAGPMLFAANGEGDFILGHGGRSPMLNTSARMNPATGNGFIMLQTGNKTALSSDMAGKWTLWESGYPDIFILRHTLPKMLKRVVIGSLIIAILSGLAMLVWLYRVKRIRPESS